MIIDDLVKHKISLSPLAGISDLAFRLLCRRHGCPYAFTEMVDISAVLHARPATFRMLTSSAEDKPLGVQLVGEDVDEFVVAAQKCADMGFDIININAACPVPKIKRKGKGVAMMNEPEKIGQLISNLTKAVDLPIVLKIRSGFDLESLTYLEVSKIAEDAGAAAIFIHPRSAESKYGSILNLDHIIALKQNISIPVFASGNVLKPADVISMLEKTGCDGVSIARGSFGQPWIFSHSQALLDGKPEPPPPSLDDIKTIVKEHFELMCGIYEPFGAVPRMYKHMTWYFAGHKRLDELMRQFRLRVSSLETFDLFLNEFE